MTRDEFIARLLALGGSPPRASADGVRIYFCNMWFDVFVSDDGANVWRGVTKINPMGTLIPYAVALDLLIKSMEAYENGT